MNVKIGTEAAQFPEKEYINGIFLAMYVAEKASWDPANRGQKLGWVLKIER